MDEHTIHDIDDLFALLGLLRDEFAGAAYDGGLEEEQAARLMGVAIDGLRDLVRTGGVRTGGVREFPGMSPRSRDELAEYGYADHDPRSP